MLVSDIIVHNLHFLVLNPDEVRNSSHHLSPRRLALVIIIRFRNFPIDIRLLLIFGSFLRLSVRCSGVISDFLNDRGI